MAKVLIIDDDEMIVDMLSRMVRHMGHEAVSALTLREGLAKASSEPIDVVFLDVWMPDGNGLEMLPVIRETPSLPEVIIITGAGEAGGAELAIKSGAWDYIQKGTGTLESMMLPLKRALAYRKEKTTRRPPAVLNRAGIIGESRLIRGCLEVVSQAAGSEANVLITGETGTGKELFARAIHENSPRAAKSLVVVDCTALPGSLVEGLLFGHEKGAFTGAEKAQEGLIAQADGGTLFLDEIGELPLLTQKAFLRVLQERRFRPLGGQKEIKSDFRLAAATNRDLDKMVQDGLFRQDLMYRLKAFTINLPPLRERPDDIQELAVNQMSRLCQRLNTGIKGFSPEFLEALMAYDWPGNVRELINALTRALAVAQYEPTLVPKHLPPDIRIQVARRSFRKSSPASPDPGAPTEAPHPSFPKWKDEREAALEKLENKYLNELISHTGGDINKACELSGLKRSRLYQLLKKHDIPSRP